jgi:hypothetical protein
MSDEPCMAASPWYAIGQLQRAFDSLAAARDAADRAERPTWPRPAVPWLERQVALDPRPGHAGPMTLPVPWGPRFVPALGGLAVRW